MTSSKVNTDRLRSLRERRVGRQADLAGLIGVNQFTVSRWENGHAQPSVVNLLKLAELLRVDVDYLVSA